MKNLKMLLVFLLVSILFMSFVGFAMTADLQKVTIQVEGSAVPYYIPIFMGIELGYFETEGLEVEYFFGGASDIVKNVAVGNVELVFRTANLLSWLFLGISPLRLYIQHINTASVPHYS